MGHSRGALVVACICSGQEIAFKRVGQKLSWLTHAKAVVCNETQYFLDFSGIVTGLPGLFIPQARNFPYVHLFKIQ